MKINIKRRLQIRFVILSFAAILLLQSLIVGFSIWKSYQNMTVKADRIIVLTKTEPDSPEADDVRYFHVAYNIENKSFEIDLSHTSLVSRALATDYAKKVIDRKTDKGYIDDYRYLVNREKDAIRITFLSRSTALDAFRSNTKALLLISAVGMAATAIMLIIVSGKVVAPIVKNRQKQKEFITSASHELKTPLTVIHADAQLLESEIGENEWLSDIIKQTNNMTEMTRRLVYLARAEEQGEHFVKIDFPVSDIADEIAESYRAVAQSSEKKYQTDIEKGLSYCGDENAIRELMSALLDNAFKYSTPDAAITIRLWAEGHGICFSVENTVAGIRPEQLSSFSERFFRADTSNKVNGFGIGLSLARAVAEAHKGKLTAALIKDNTVKFTAVLK